jgi:hypothetical protein
MGFKTTSTRFTQTKSAQSSDYVAFNNAATGNASISGTSLTANSVITTYTAVPGANASAGTTTVSGGSGSSTIISSIVYTDQNYNTLTANAASTTFGYVRILGSGFATGANVFLSNTSTSVLSNVTANTTFVGSGEIRANVPGISVGNYTLYVFNPTGSAAIYYSGLTFEPYPIWNTPSSLTSSNVAVNISLAGYVTSTSGVQPITFALAAGNTLPSGLTLSSSGVISGTTAITGISQTFYLYINAIDLYNETTTSGNIALTLASADAQFIVATTLLNGETTATSFIADSSSNNTAVVITGNAKPTLTTPYLGDGYYSNYFDGSTGNLAISYNTNLNLGSVGSWTIETWGFVANATFGTYTPVNFYQDGTNRWDLEISSTTTNVLYNNTTNKVFTNPITLTTNQWYHFAVTRDGSTVRMFINGIVSPTTDTNNFNSLASGTFYVGSNTVPGYPQYSFWWAGYLSNLRLTKGQALYTANFTPSTTSLSTTANTVLLTSQSSSLVDKSLNNFTLTKNGTVNVSPATPFGIQTSSTVNTGYSVLFNGSTDYLSLSSASSLNIASTTPCCFEMWVNPNSVSVSNGQELFQAGSGNLAFLLLNGGAIQPGKYGFAGFAQTTATISAGVWTHLALTSDGSNNWRVFINGVLQGYQSYNISPNNSAMQIGGGNAGNSYFGGYISNFRVTVGSIPAAYVTASTTVGTSVFTPSTTPLTAITNTQLLTCQGNTIVDASANALVVTSNGKPKPYNNTYPFTQPTVSLPTRTYSATYFNGSTDYVTVPNINFSTNAFTIEGWFYPTTLAIGTNFWGSDNAAGGNPKMIMYIDSSSRLTVDFGNAGTTQFPVAVSVSSAGLITNQWNHIAVVRSNLTLTGFTIYVNGLPIGTGQVGTNLNTITAPFNIGYIGEAYGAPFAGYIADFRIVNGSAVYTYNFAPTYQPQSAVANTSLLTLQYSGGANNGGFADNSEFNNTVTRGVTPAQGTFSPYSQMGWSNYFNGSTDYLSIANNAAFNFGTGDFTIEMWFNIAGDSPLDGGSQKNAVLFSNLNASGAITGLTAILFGSSSVTGTGIGLYYFVSNTGYTYGFSGTAFTKNVWYHLAFSMTGGTIKTYINGTLQDTETPTQNVTSTNAFLIGASAQTSYQRFFNGYISNFRVVKGTGLYTSAFTPSTSPLTAVANTQLLTCKTNQFNDTSTNNFTITLSGTPSVQAVTPFSPSGVYSPTANGGSVYFNGSTDYLTIPNSPLHASYPGDFTVEGWFYLTSLPGTGTIITHRNNSSGSAAYVPFIIWTESSTLKLYVSSTNSSWDVVNGASLSTVTTNQWYHFAYTRSGSAIKFFLNGAQVYTTTSSAAFNTAQPLQIGSTINEVSFMTGYVSDIRITKAAVYTSAFTPTTSTLTNYSNTTPSTLLLNFNNGGIIDQHSSFNYVTIGNVQTSTSTVKYGSKSLRFTGTSGAYLQSVQTLPALTWWIGSFTIEYWIYANAFSQGSNSESTAIGNMTGASTTTYWSFGPISAGTVRWYYNNGSAQNLTTSATLSTGQWYHLAFVNNAGSLAIYINGTSSATGTISGTPQAAAATPLTVGSSNNVVFNGYLDDVRITKYARYTGNFTPPVTGFLGQ